MTDSEVRALLRPEAWPEATAPAKLIQTHTSWVLLTGKYAYKIKKPVFFGFLDYRTLGARKVFCEEELRLNRRLSPDIYVGVKPIMRRGRKIGVGGKGKIVDYCLKMKELPQSAIMSELLNRKAVTYPMIDEIARIVAKFHQTAATDDEIGKLGDIETVKFNWDENFAQTEEFRGRTISAKTFRLVKAIVDRFMIDNLPLFKLRVKENRIRECHGDLHSRNIFIRTDDDGADPDARPPTPDPRFDVRIFDCIEFNRRFSCCDVASEIAFFVMDLEYHGEKGLANYFVDRYLQATGDSLMLKLLDFYKCYRAYVRGKVTSFMLNDPGVPAAQKREGARSARKYFKLAAHYATSLNAQPALILVMGLPGVGKTYLAERLARHLNCYHLRSDIIRKELMAMPVGEHAFQGVGRGIYESSISGRTYDEMHRRAGNYLAADRTVIMDATFSFETGRRVARGIAAENDARFLIVNCTCPVKVALKRIIHRSRGFSFSDATPDVYFHIRKTFQSPRKSRSLVTVDTTDPVRTSLQHIEKALQSPMTNVK